MSMKYIMAFVALVALVASASAANLVNIGNGMQYDIPYIVLQTPVANVDLVSNGMHIQGLVYDYFGDGSKTFVGTYAYTNGSLVQPISYAEALGAALAIVGVTDFSSLAIAQDANGAYNAVTDIAAAKAGLPLAVSGAPSTYVIVMASNHQGGTETVAYLNTVGQFVYASQANQYRASSF